MKGILIAGVFVAFAIAVIDSLSCRQCSPLSESCSNNVTECAEGSVSCVESLVNSTLGGSPYLYQNRSCSADNCPKNSAQVAFTVHVFDDQSFHFASQCCQGEACNDTNHGTQAITNTQCSACYSYNTTTACKEKTRQCFQGERCVHIIAYFVNGTERNKVELKGCSDISESTCETLAPGNTTVGEFFFRSVICENATTINTLTTKTPPTSTGIKASFTSSVFGSLLLLKLLF